MPSQGSRDHGGGRNELWRVGTISKGHQNHERSLAGQVGRTQSWLGTFGTWRLWHILNIHWIFGSIFLIICTYVCDLQYILVLLALLLKGKNGPWIINVSILDRYSGYGLVFSQRLWWLLGLPASWGEAGEALHLQLLWWRPSGTHDLGRLRQRWLHRRDYQRSSLDLRQLLWGLSLSRKGHLEVSINGGTPK